MSHEEAVKKWTDFLTTFGTIFGGIPSTSVDAARGMLDILARHTPSLHDKVCRCCGKTWPCPDARACAVDQ